jgi:hypothetical protein
LTNQTLKTISSKADSLIELLVAQCGDLEALLKLAKLETTAAEKQNFEELLNITRDRATLGERLETYHRQISELRATMDSAAEHVIQSTVAKEAIQLALAIHTQDSKTSSMLVTMRANTNETVTRLDQGRRGSVAYLSEGRTGGLKCDRRA